MNNFYSSLIINSRNFPGVHQVFRPRYNKEYFKRINANITQLDSQIKQRCHDDDPNLSVDRLNDLRENSQKLVKLKERLEKFVDNEAEFRKILDQIESIEDRLMPTVISIPNRSSKTVPAKDTTIDEIKSDFQSKQNLVKILSYRKLSYINNCYSKSVIGPNSHYYFGIGAKLNHALTAYFSDELEKSNFIHLSGLCLTKSAVVEAANSKDCKEYFNDPARIVEDSPIYTTLHLNEASRESLVGFITTIGPIVSNDPLRLMTSGACYRSGSDWFDGDDKRITQSETVHALVLNSSIEQYSMREYHSIRDLVWSSYKKLQLPARLVHCSPMSMFMNEFDSHRIDLWLPSRREWIQGARVSHHRDHITIRTGMKRGHLIDSMVFDGQLLVAVIMENRQTSFGKFIIPEVLQAHSTYLTSEERDNYFKQDASTYSNGKDSHTGSKIGVLTNHEQRRYLVKRNYFLGHSRKAEKMLDDRDGYAIRMSAFLMIIFTLVLIDWTSIWLDYIPDKRRAFMYDKIYRPLRRIWWYATYEEGAQPEDTPYDEIDKTEYPKTKAQRKREQVLINVGRKS